MAFSINVAQSWEASKLSLDMRNLSTFCLVVFESLQQIFPDTIVINKAILTSILIKNIRPNNISINGYIYPYMVIFCKRVTF